jgi:hypothetical protein
MVTKLVLNTELIKRIRQHALANYEQGGWDYLVECYSDNDIILLVAECESFEQAIDKLGRIMAIKDDYRSDIQGEAF